MSTYNNILIAVELIPEEDQIIIAKAKLIAEKFSGTLSLVHAVQDVSTYGTASAYPAIADIEEEIMQEHKTALTNLGTTLNIPNNRQFYDFGSPGRIITDTATKINADLIIVGSRSRHGIALLLGSTADSIIHRANCDVIAVHLPE